MTPDTMVEPYRRILADPASTLEQRIRAGAELWRLVQLAQATLEPLKDQLRAEALLRLGKKPGTVVLEGSGMSRAQVNVPEVSLRLTSPPDLIAAQQELGDYFTQVYRVEVALVPRSPAEVGKMPKRVQTHLARRVQLVEGKPRVSLTLLFGVEPMP